MKLSSIPHSVSMIENEEALNNAAEVSDFDPLQPSMSGDTPKRKEWNSFKTSRLSMGGPSSNTSTPMFQQFREKGQKLQAHHQSTQSMQDSKLIQPHTTRESVSISGGHLKK